MAKVLESFEFKRAGREAKYPWKEWLDGRVWQIERGEDFGPTAERMRIMVSRTAERFGVKVRTSVSGDTVIFQAITDRPKLRAAK